MPLFFRDTSLIRYRLGTLCCMDIQLSGEGCAQAKKQAAEQRTEMTGMERLVLRVSSMINHPIAQTQRWVTIHQLDTDSDQSWEEVMSMIAETPGIEMTFSDDGSVTLQWEADEEQTSTLAMEEAEAEEEFAAPF